MAFSSTVALKSVFGNARVVVLSMVADSGSGDTSAQGTGLGYVFAATVGPVSMATSSPKTKINVLQAGTSAAGQCTVSGISNGDVFYLTLYGRS